MKKFFAQKEIEFLKNNYPSKGIEFCSNYLKRSKWSLYHFCNRHDIKYTNEYRKFNHKESGKKQSITKSKIKTIHNVDETKFIKIKTPESAYLLGLIWSDGNIYMKKATNTISVSCLLDDMLNIESMFNKTGKWNKYVINQKGRRPQLKMTTNNKELCKFLLENDYHSKSESSADKILSIIPNNLKHYWFRGLIDGDGCFYFHNNHKEITIASSYNQNWNYILELCNKLNVECKIKKTIQIQNNHENRSSVIRIRKFNSIKKFGDYIYKNIENDKIGFNRKYEKFKQICILFGNNQKPNDALHA